MNDTPEEDIRPDPASQKRFNIMMVIMLAAAGVLFFWVEPMLYDKGIGPLLGDAYNVADIGNIAYSITPELAQRLAFQSDFYLALFFGALVVSLFLPLGSARAVIVKRFLQDYSIKCRAEFYLPYLTMLVFLATGVWLAGMSFLDYEANSRIGFLDSILTRAAPFLAVIAASMIAAILKGLAVFRLVLGEVGAPKPDIANVPGRYIMPWGLRTVLFKPVLARSHERFPDTVFTLGRPGYGAWAFALIMLGLGLYNIFSHAEGLAPLHTALVWVAIGVGYMPITRIILFNMTGQSLSLNTHLALVICLFIISGTFSVQWI